MFKTAMTLTFGAATAFAGYVGGSAWPAPPQLMQAINARASDFHARLKLEQTDIAGIQDLMSREKYIALTQQIESIAAAAGHVILVDHDLGTLEEQLDNLAMSEEEAFAHALSPSAPAPEASPFAPEPVKAAFNATMMVCPRMAVQNSPGADADGEVSPFAPVVLVDGVRLATGPVSVGCLSSGFGPRNERLHKGVDYHSATGGPVLAAGDGHVAEIVYRSDYGNMLLIDHGQGVFTRYAHLASFAPGLSAGVTVRGGEQIGLMGNSGAYAVPIHLHYEILRGDYDTPRRSFGLTSVDPYSLPAAT